MAEFQRGMKVKRVREPLGTKASMTFLPIGATGTVLNCDGESVWVLPDEGGKGEWGCEPQTLEPLLPPDEAADAFLARIKKLGSEPINDAPKVTVEVLNARA